MSQGVQDAIGFHNAVMQLSQSYGTHLQRLALELDAARKEAAALQKKVAEGREAAALLEKQLADAKEHALKMELRAREASNGTARA